MTPQQAKLSPEVVRIRTLYTVSGWLQYMRNVLLFLIADTLILEVTGVFSTPTMVVVGLLGLLALVYRALYNCLKQILNEWFTLRGKELAGLFDPNTRKN